MLQFIEKRFITSLPMLKFLFLFIPLLTAFSAFSQVRSTKSFIVFANNDSLTTEIKDDPLQDIQTRIRYLEPDSKQFITGLPETIKSLKFTDGRLFETIKSDSVSCLLLCLIEGYYNLYSKIESNGLKTYFIRHENDTPIHLFETFRDQYMEADGKTHKLSNFEYAHILTYAMADNAVITTEINKTRFTEHDLVSILKKYNQFKGDKYPDPAFLNKKSTKISAGILTSAYPFLHSFIFPGLGLSFDFYKNRPYERFKLKTHVSFNILEYKKNDSYKLLFETPIALSYSYLDRGRFKMDISGGVTSFLLIDSRTSYNARRTYTSLSPNLYLGTGLDYKIKNSVLRFEFSLLTLSFALAYIF